MKYYNGVYNFKLQKKAHLLNHEVDVIEGFIASQYGEEFISEICVNNPLSLHKFLASDTIWKEETTISECSVCGKLICFCGFDL